MFRYSVLLAASTLALLQSVRADSWGPAYSLGPTSAAIIEAVTTFVPGDPPAVQVDYLFLWPGISNSTSGLIQAGADSTAYQSSYCGATDTQWCVGASYYGVVDGETTQLEGDVVPADGDTEILIHYLVSFFPAAIAAVLIMMIQLLDDDTVTIDGKVTSRLQSYDGPLLNGGWGTGTECQSNCTGSESTQYYYNTTITLSAADVSFKDTLAVGEGITATDLTTSDDGITWYIESIEIPPMVTSSSDSTSSTSETAAETTKSFQASSAAVIATDTAAAASPSDTSAAPSGGFSGGSGSESSSGSQVSQHADSGSPFSGQAQASATESGYEGEASAAAGGTSSSDGDAPQASGAALCGTGSAFGSQSSQASSSSNSSFSGSDTGSSLDRTSSQAASGGALDTSWSGLKSSSGRWSKQQF
ncbi:hypothetical protein FISHEDRAFT_78348 [Fistulina hepatica ATCC 64428]|nr:hypothetical protein FISHEDRAFT_78348 [Fistulina hepatica ATCC 64428]